MVLRPAARLLLIEGEALQIVLETLSRDDYDFSTVCEGWSVRDVLAHCGAALTRTASDDLHRFRPEDNQADVDERRSWDLDAVIEELFKGYEDAADAIEEADGKLDGIGLGEWIHGGDVRDAIGAPEPYTSDGAYLARNLLLERSRSMGKPPLLAMIDHEEYAFGSGEAEPGVLDTNLETFVRLCGGRKPNPADFTLDGYDESEMILFS